MKLEDAPTSIKDDALTLLCLNLLGTGISRQVYTCTIDPLKLVVKAEVESIGYFQNVKEYLVWDSVKEVKAIADWFAPCVNISDNGRWMVQMRTQPARAEELPERIPRLFTDCKISNWGWYDGRIVCHDYGTCLITENGITAHMKKADWW